MSAGPPGRAPTTRSAVVVGLLIGLLGAGWFVLSHVVMGTATGDALGEMVGVILGLLLVASVVGAVRAGRGRPG